MLLVQPEPRVTKEILVPQVKLAQLVKKVIKVTRVKPELKESKV